jgi:hypothetical protein
MLGVPGSAWAGVIYEENFDDGVANGFTLNSLWHVTPNFPASSPNALGYVQGESAGGTLNGNFDTGAANSGSATSPSINIPGSGATLSFDALCACEGGLKFDLLSVNILHGVSTPVADSNAFNKDSDPSYGPVTILLGAFAGETIQIQFFFDTIDLNYNDFAGPRIDNIVVRTPDVVGIPEPGTVLLFASGLLGFAGLLRKRALNHH